MDCVDVTSDAAVNNAVPRCTRCKGRGRTKGKIHSQATLTIFLFFPLLLLHSLVKNDISMYLYTFNTGVDSNKLQAI